MPRKPRVVAVNLPHHVTQRGVRSLPIFTCKEDRLVYLGLFSEHAKKNKLDVLAYCLMTNHIHLIVVPLAADSMAKTLRDAHISYAVYFNRRSGLKGHLFENRYFSTPMDDDHSWKAIRYVELNPVRAGIVSKAEDYEWSSAKKHCCLVSEDPLLQSKHGLERRLGQHWSQWLANGDSSEDRDKIRKYSRLGLPLGSPGFVRGLEARFGRNLQPGLAGRPRNREK